ncbi:MAG TPA: SOS response-associated peptidase [Rhizomicrobium sp.]|nr:SOS response-associated peptidase [Rhizomicrobium sp.]
MCSRICLSTSLDEIANRFEASAIGGKPRLRPHWNIVAGQILPAIRWSPLLQRRRLDLMRWGLVSAWANNTMIVSSNLDVAWGGDMIRRSAQRCLIPVDSFYEWRLADKQPFAVALANRQIMALAGLWDLRISPLGERIECFTILATDTNDLLAPLCRRMPAVIFPEDWDLWLGKEPAAAARIFDLLKPCAEDRLMIWPIDRKVGNVKNDDPSILATVENP